MTSGKLRVLIADDDTKQARILCEFLNANGFSCRSAAAGFQARDLIFDWRPRYVIADLMLPELNAMTLLTTIKGDPRLRHHFWDVIVMSSHNNPSNVKQALFKGAKDYIVKPFRPEDVLKRLIFHSRGSRKIQDAGHVVSRPMDEPSMVLHLTELVLRQGISLSGFEDILFNLTRMVSMKLQGVRCSVVECLSQTHGIVVTSNDNRDASGIRLNLNNYPEIIHVMNTDKLLAIENIDDNPQLRGIKTQIKDLQFNSLVVCPLQRCGRFFGVLSLRLPPEKEIITDNEIRFTEIVAHVVSLVLTREDFSSQDFWTSRSTNNALPFIKKNPLIPKKKAMD